MSNIRGEASLGYVGPGGSSLEGPRGEKGRKSDFRDVRRVPARFRGSNATQTSRNRLSAMVEPTRPTIAATPASSNRTPAISPVENVSTGPMNGMASPILENSRALPPRTIAAGYERSGEGGEDPLEHERDPDEPVRGADELHDADLVTARVDRQA